MKTTHVYLAQRGVLGAPHILEVFRGLLKVICSIIEQNIIGMMRSIFSQPAKLKHLGVAETTAAIRKTFF